MNREWSEITKLLCLMILAVMSIGCASALHVSNIEPVYALKAQPRGIKVTVNDFKISGHDNNTIGMAKTGLFNVSTPIVSDVPVTTIVRNAVKKGFEGAGFAVVDLPNADYSIDGTVEKFWVEEYATGLSLEFSKAYVRYDLMLKEAQGKTIWASTQEKFKTSDKNLETTDYNIPTLTSALQESVEAIFENKDFLKAISGQ
jgi:hypothetical protein